MHNCNLVVFLNFHMQSRSFRQDRLGTNVRSTQNKTAVCLGNHQRNANVYLEAIPSQLIITNSYGFDYAPRYVNPAMQVVRVSPLLDLVSG